MALSLRHQTAAQFAARLRERFRDAERTECARIAHWIMRRIAVGDVTENQVRNAFGLTVQQWNALKANKLEPLRDAWAAVKAAQGE